MTTHPVEQYLPQKIELRKWQQEFAQRFLDFAGTQAFLEQRREGVHPQCIPRIRENDCPVGRRQIFDFHGSVRLVHGRCSIRQASFRLRPGR